MQERRVLEEAHVLVIEDLPALHRPHYGGVDGILAVLVHVLDHFLLLVNRRQRYLFAASTS